MNPNTMTYEYYFPKLTPKLKEIRFKHVTMREAIAELLVSEIHDFKNFILHAQRYNLDVQYEAMQRRDILIDIYSHKLDSFTRHYEIYLAKQVMNMPEELTYGIK